MESAARWEAAKGREAERIREARQVSEQDAMRDDEASEHLESRLGLLERLVAGVEERLGLGDAKDGSPPATGTPSPERRRPQSARK